MQERGSGAQTPDERQRALETRRRHWTFLTNHAAALLLIAENPGIRLVDLAERIGVSVRAAQMIVSDLVEEGYLTRTRIGRRNAYSVRRSRPLRRGALSNRATVAGLLSVLGANGENGDEPS